MGAGCEVIYWRILFNYSTGTFLEILFQNQPSYVHQSCVITNSNTKETGTSVHQCARLIKCNSRSRIRKISLKGHRLFSKNGVFDTSLNLTCYDICVK